MRLKPRASQIDCLRHEPKVQGWQGCSNQREPPVFNPILFDFNPIVALPKSGGKSDYHVYTPRYVTLICFFYWTLITLVAPYKSAILKKLMKWKRSLKKKTNKKQKKITKGDGNKNVTNHKQVYASWSAFEFIEF